MTSIFFQISSSDYIESVPLDTSNLYFAVRIVSFKNGYDHYVVLPHMTINELKTFIMITRARLMSNVVYLTELQRYMYSSY